LNNQFINIQELIMRTMKLWFWAEASFTSRSYATVDARKSAAAISSSNGQIMVATSGE